jgi:hypothetical protein
LSLTQKLGNKGGVAKVSNELLKTENALVLNCMKAFAGTFGSPAIMALGAFDPWLCVTAFRQFCPFVDKIIKKYNRTFRRRSQILLRLALVCSFLWFCKKYDIYTGN